MLINFFFLLMLMQPLPKESTFLLMSVPKSGTHLMENLLTALTYREHHFLRHAFSLQTSYRVDPTAYFNCHFNEKLDLKKFHALVANIPVFINVRDPRDVCVSSVPYYWQVFDVVLGKNTTFDERLSYTIQFMGLHNFFGPYFHFERCFEAMDALKPLLVKYEDLVGPLGGGDLEIQKKTILEIAKRLNISLSESDAIRLGDEIYGHSETFRVGKIGSWKSAFKEVHKKQFKQSAFQNVLIKLGYEKDDQW